LCSIFSFYVIFFVSCQTNTGRQDKQKAKQLYSDGMGILRNRISIQSVDKIRAITLNKKAIEKFSAAYEADTSVADAVLFASECTMYEKDYQNCAYWTSKLMQLDTSRRNQLFCNDRIEYCKTQLQSEQEK
jgi:hypothetical protein